MDAHAVLGSRPPEGGIERSRFVRPDVVSDFVCAVCQDIFRTPEETPCGHAFCAGCIRTAISYTPACPLCQLPVTLESLHSAKFLARLLDEQHVHCRHQDQGCVWVGFLSQEPQHLAFCTFEHAAVNAIDDVDKPPPAYAELNRSNSVQDVAEDSSSRPGAEAADDDGKDDDKIISIGPSLALTFEGRTSLLRLGNDLFQRRQFRKARRVFEHLLVAGVSTVEARTKLGMMLWFGMGQVDVDRVAARRHFDYVVRKNIDPEGATDEEVRDAKVTLQLECAQLYAEQKITRVFVTLIVLDEMGLLLPQSEALLGDILFYGASPVQRDVEAAMMYYERAAARGHERSTFWLAVLASDSGDEVRASKLFDRVWRTTQAALLHRAEHKTRLGEYEKALTPLKIFSAHEACADGLHLYGDYLLLGTRGEPKDPQRARRAQELAVRLGWVPHEHLIAQADDAKEVDCPRLGRQCVQNAGDACALLETFQGRLNHKQHYWRARFYDKVGRHHEAARAYLHVVSKGSETGVEARNAHFRLGELYRDGRFIELDVKASKQHFRRALALNHPDALQELADERPACVVQ